MTQATDRWILAGAVALAVGSVIGAGMAVNARPESPEWLVKLEAEVAWKQVAPSRLPPTPDYLTAFYYNNRVTGGTQPASDWAGYLKPIEIEKVRPRGPKPPLQVHQVAYPLGIESTLETVTVEWVAEVPEFDNPEERPVEIVPAASFRIERSVNGGPFRRVAQAEPTATRYVDRDVAPLTDYAYRVIAVGSDEETHALHARTPSRVRVTLVGGDAQVALLRVERYDTGTWTGRTVTARPGDGIGPSTGWRLEALRFDKSTLTATVTDDAGKTRTLKTKR